MMILEETINQQQNTINYFKCGFLEILPVFPNLSIRKVIMTTPDIQRICSVCLAYIQQ